MSHDNPLAGLPKSGKVLATIGVGMMAPVLDATLPTFRKFASTHGYDLIIGDGHAAGRPPAWGKVSLCRRLLDSYEQVLWIDADAIILQTDRDIASEMPGDAFQAMVSHSTGWSQEAPNAGVWLLRGQRAAEFLDAVWAMDKYIDHNIWENGAVCELLGYSIDPYHRVQASPWMDGTVFLDETWNRHYLLVGLQQGRIRHYAGMSNEFRRRRMLIDRADLEGRRFEALVRRIEWRLHGSRKSTSAPGSRG
jgi:hypothetical protein